MQLVSLNDEERKLVKKKVDRVVKNLVTSFAKKAEKPESHFAVPAQQLAENCAKIVEDSVVSYQVQGNFTLCILKFSPASETGFVMGVTKRNCECDQPVPERAQQLALKRAVENYVTPLATLKLGGLA